MWGEWEGTERVNLEFSEAAEGDEAQSDVWTERDLQMQKGAKQSINLCCN